MNKKRNSRLYEPIVSLPAGQPRETPFMTDEEMKVFLDAAVANMERRQQKEAEESK